MILTANGCDENAMTAIQRELTAVGVRPTVVSVEQGLITTWSGQGFGLNFTVDQHVSTALAADTDALIILSGERSVTKLNTSLHTERIVKGFLDGQKPIAFFGNGVELLAVTKLASGLMLSGPVSSKDKMVAAGAKWSDESPCMANHIISGDLVDVTAYAQTAVQFIAESFATDALPKAA
jgi:protease I